MAPQTILISGTSGLVGSALVAELERVGHRVLRLVRREPVSELEVRWNPSAHLFDERQIATVDAVVNLAGEPIDKRWTETRRRHIRASRIDATDALVTAIGKMRRRGITLINASAVGFYGNRGDDLLDERQPAGRGFLADVCNEWERAANAATRLGARVVTMRMGLVLSRDGGALPAMLTPFRLGVGGRLGSGRQWMSWITIDDAVRGIAWLIEHPAISGPVNMVSPNPVTNAEFTNALGRTLGRPTVFAVPSFVLRSIFGEMADETLLSSQRAVPKVLAASGFTFEAPTIDTALTKVLRDNTA